MKGLVFVARRKWLGGHQSSSLIFIPFSALQRIKPAEAEDKNNLQVDDADHPGGCMVHGARNSK